MFWSLVSANSELSNNVITAITVQGIIYWKFADLSRRFCCSFKCAGLLLAQLNNFLQFRPNTTKRVGLVKPGHHHQLIECHLCSPWYSRKIVHLTLRNIPSLTLNNTNEIKLRLNSYTTEYKCVFEPLNVTTDIYNPCPIELSKTSSLNIDHKIIYLFLLLYVLWC